MRADDGFGPELVKALEGCTAVELLDCGTAPENYIFRVLELKPDTLIFADATDFGRKPGEIDVFALSEVDHLSFSTHNASLGLLRDLVLVERPEVTGLWVLAVQPKDLTFGSPMSQEVRNAIKCIKGVMAHA